MTQRVMSGGAELSVVCQGGKWDGVFTMLATGVVGAEARGISMGESRDRILLVPARHIGANPYEPRKTIIEASIWELALDIGLNGLHHAVMLRNAGDDAGLGQIFERVFGQRRHLAFLKLDDVGWVHKGETLPWAAEYYIEGITVIPAVVRGDMSDAELIMASLSENSMRESVSFEDETRAMQVAIEADVGLNQTSLAEAVGMSKGQVSNRLRILRLPQEILTLINNGNLAWTQARTLLCFATRDHRHDEELVLAGNYLTTNAGEEEKRILGVWFMRNAIRTALDDRSVGRKWEHLETDYRYYSGGGRDKGSSLFDVDAFQKAYPKSIHRLPIRYFTGEKEKKSMLWTCRGKEWRAWQLEARAKIKAKEAADAVVEPERPVFEYDQWQYCTRDRDGYIGRPEYRGSGYGHKIREFRPDHGDKYEDSSDSRWAGRNCRIETDDAEVLMVHWHAEWSREEQLWKGDAELIQSECFGSREEALACLDERNPECGWITRHESEQRIGPVVTGVDRARRAAEEEAAEV